MSKVTFTDNQVKSLEKNKYVKKVSNKAITYTYEFKRKFIKEYKNNKLPRVIFEEAGFDIEIIGIKRAKEAASRWKKTFEKDGEIGLKDKRKNSSGRPLVRKLSQKEEVKRLKAQIEYLKIENDFLKKLDEIERGDF